jgi:flagellar biosynthesis/type III secretory pathway chaperone
MDTIVYDELRTLLPEMRAQVHNLWACLCQERDVLATHDAAKLSALALTKNQLVERLDQLELQRQDLLRKAQLPVQSLDADEFASYAQTQGIAAGLIIEIKQMLHQCFEINQVNGAIMGMRLRQINQGLTLLRGETHGSFYEASGRLGRSTSGRPISRA